MVNKIMIQYKTFVIRGRTTVSWLFFKIRMTNTQSGPKRGLELESE